MSDGHLAAAQGRSEDGQGGPLTTAAVAGTPAPMLMLRDGSLPEDHKAVGLLLHSALRWLFAGPQPVLQPGAHRKLLLPVSTVGCTLRDAVSSVHSGCNSLQV